MSNNNNDLKKILSNNFEKIKEFVEENTIAVAAVGAFAVLGGIYLLKSSKVNDDIFFYFFFLRRPRFISV